MSEKNESQHQVYGIPRNLKSAGKIADVIEMTALVQGIIIAFVAMIICLRFFNLPFRYTFFIMGLLFLFVVMPYGKNSDTFTKYMYLKGRNFFCKRTYRRYVKHKSSKKRRIDKERRERELLLANEYQSMEGGK